MIRIQALGGLSVRGDDGRPFTGAVAQPRRMAVLALLSRSPERGVSRDRLIAMLWPDTEEERARNNLAQALYALRRDLGAEDAIAGTKELRLDPSRVTTDVGEFCAAVTRGQDLRAAELYAGPFLDGFHLPSSPDFERWADDERRKLAHDHARVLESLARGASGRGDAAEAVAWWRKLAAIDPLNARYAIALMEALAAAGDRAGALRHARVYEVLLEQELDLPPDREVVALAERIRRDAETPPPTAAAVGAIAAAPLPKPPPALPASTASPDSEPITAPEPPRTAAVAASPPATPEGRSDEPLLLPYAAMLSEGTAGVAALPADAGDHATTSPARAGPVAAPLPQTRVPPLPPAERPRAPGSRRAVVLAAVAVVALAVLAALGAALGARSRGAARAADRLVPGPTRRVAFDAPLELDPSLSPDGKLLVYAADAGGAMRLFVKQAAGGGRAVPITVGLGGYHRAPRWSPDGNEVAFQAGGTIYVVPAFGGTPRVLVRPEPPARWVAYPTWSPDGREIAYSQEDTLFVRPAAGGPARRLAAAPPWPHSLAWSPDGAWLAVVSGNSTFVYGRGGEGSPVNVGNAAPSSVWLVAARGGGAAVRVTDDRALNVSPVWLPDSRALLFVSNRDGERDVYRVDLGDDGRPAGEPTRLTVGLGAHTVALSSDGRRLAYSVFHLASNVWQLAIPAAGSAPATAADATPLTSGSQAVEGVGVSPDGRWLAFDSDRGGNQDIYKMPADGSGDVVQLTADSADEFMPDWSPNGREIAFHAFRGGGDRRVEVVSADGGVPVPVVALPRNQRFPGWSPDGTALVFTSDATGAMELYVARRGGHGAWGEARRLTSRGGFNGRWSPTGREIAYTRPDGIWAIPVTADSAAGPPRQVLRTDPTTGPVVDVVHWSPDGATLFYKAFDADGHSSIWSVPAAAASGAATAAPRLLVRFDDARRQSSRPEFATDGRRLFFTISESASDVWMMELGRGGR